MFNKTTTTTQFRQPIDGIHDQIKLHLIFMLQMWNICVVCISCCNHVTCAKHARGYTCEKKHPQTRCLNQYQWLFLMVCDNSGGFHY